MRKSVWVLAILTAAVSTAAVAKDLKQDKKAAVPTVTAAQMTDSEMDKVTAGFGWTNPGGRYIQINDHALRACVHGSAPFCP
jgi:hypothetical protein